MAALDYIEIEHEAESDGGQIIFVKNFHRSQSQKFIKGTNGFEVYSLSLDKDKNRWIGAIEKDQLSWDYHVSDLKGWSSEGARKYGVRSIPTTYLIDEEGYIIGINPSSAIIEMEMEKRLKKKK